MKIRLDKKIRENKYEIKTRYNYDMTQTKYDIIIIRYKTRIVHNENQHETILNT